MIMGRGWRDCDLGDPAVRELALFALTDIAAWPDVGAMDVVDLRFLDGIPWLYVNGEPLELVDLGSAE